MTVNELLIEVSKLLYENKIDLTDEITIEYDSDETRTFLPTGGVEVGLNNTLRILEKNFDWGRE